MGVHTVGCSDGGVDFQGRGARCKGRNVGFDRKAFECMCRGIEVWSMRVEA